MECNPEDPGRLWLVLYLVRFRSVKNVTDAKLDRTFAKRRRFSRTE